MRSPWKFVIAALAGAALAGDLSAQGTGTVTGTVTAEDRTPLDAVRILVVGLGRTVSTDAHGRFHIAAVPAGERIVTVQRIGYARVSDTVTVTAGSVTEVQVVMRAAAVLVQPMSVIASRGAEEALGELPVSAAVLSREEIARIRPTHVAETLNRLSGVRIVQFDGDGSHNAVRQPLCCRATILITEDGIPLAPPSFYTTSMIGGVNYAQTAQVEALKGPGTAAYGSDAVTGVINFVSAAPPSTPEAQVTVEGGPYGYTRGMLSTGGTFGAHGVRFSGVFADADGRREDPYRRMNAGVRWDVATRGGAVFRTIVTYNQLDGTGSDDQSPDQFTERSTFNPYPIAFNDFRTLRASVSYRQRAGRTSWSVTPFFRFQNSDRVPGWQLSYDPVVWDIDYRSVGLISQLRHEFGGAFDAQLTAGIDADWSPLDRREPVITPTEVDGVWVDWSTTTEPPHYDYTATYRGAATYAQIEVSPIRRLRLSAGARLDLAAYDYDNHLSPVDTGFFRRPADTLLSYQKVTPKFGATFALADAASVFGSYRRGFRVPLESQLFKQGASESTTGLRPVEVEAVELGFRAATRRVRGEVSAYHMELHNDILSFRGTTGVSNLTNNGETSHRGVEFSAGVAVTPELRVDGAYTYAIHRFDEWSPSADLDLSGFEMDGAPRHFGSGTITYEPRFLGGGSVQLEWTRLSDYWLDREETTRFDGYNVFHLRASYVLYNRVELYGRLINLTDELYAQQAFEGFGPIPWVASPGQYRTLYAGVRARI